MQVVDQRHQLGVAALRIGVGVIFLWAGLEKALGAGGEPRAPDKPPLPPDPAMSAICVKEPFPLPAASLQDRLFNTVKSDPGKAGEVLRLLIAESEG